MKNATPEQKRLGLHVHAIVFLLTMLLLLIINLYTGQPYWIVWVLLGWGIGLLSHWLAVRNYVTRRIET